MKKYDRQQNVTAVDDPEKRRMDDVAESHHFLLGQSILRQRVDYVRQHVTEIYNKKKLGIHLRNTTSTENLAISCMVNAYLRITELKTVMRSVNVCGR